MRRRKVIREGKGEGEERRWREKKGRKGGRGGQLQRVSSVARNAPANSQFTRRPTPINSITAEWCRIVGRCVLALNECRRSASALYVILEQSQPATNSPHCRRPLIRQRSNRNSTLIIWRLGVAVASFVACTKLLYVEPG